jgi:NAD(P)-dependent dehydrogenase (short-subunit alcohol dehydrogenase family)
MSRVFVTGSSTGLGLLACRLLASQGEEFIAHARDAGRAEDIRKALPGAKQIVIGDLETMAGATDVAAQVNQTGECDAVIHNAGIYSSGDGRLTRDGLPATFAVNTLAPYVLTALIQQPKRLVYLSSGMHLQASPRLDDIHWRTRRWNSSAAYSESKLYVTMLAFAIARLWPETRSNVVDPGWVPTRMGGTGAPDDLELGYQTQVWLATSDDLAARTSAGYFYHRQRREPNRESRAEEFQERLLQLCKEVSGLQIARGAA